MCSSSQKVTILDGGFSTQMITHVGDRIDGDPLWTARFLVTDPSAVLATHLDFLRAGSDIIETNTYQATVTGFIKYLGVTESESIRLICSAVEIAKRAVKIYREEIKEKNDVPNKNPLIAGSCGPYGASLHDGSEYTGEYAADISVEMMKEWHRPRIEALINSNVDLLALETIPCAAEAEAVVELLREYPNTKAWLTFSCKTDGKHVVDGTNFQDIATRCYRNALPGQIVAIGINCLAPQCVAPFFRGINKSDGEFIPLVIYPNSGETYTVSDGWKNVGNVCPLENFIHEWLDLGVRYVGGCCRTYSDDITKIRGKVDEWESRREQMLKVSNVLN